MSTRGRARRRRAGAAVAAGVALGSLSAIAPVSASPLFELLGDTAGTSGLSAGTSRVGAGSAAAYFNPALLTYARQGIELGTFFLWDDIAIELGARPDGVDVPLGFRGANHTGTYVVDGVEVIAPSIAPDSLPTAWLEQGCPSPSCEPGFEARPRGDDSSSRNLRAYQTVGLVQGLFADRLAVGVHAILPLGDFTTAHAFHVDEREQFFSNSLHPELYSDRLTATSLALGVGLVAHERVRLGLSATVALRNDAAAATYVSDSDNQSETLVLSTDVAVRARMAPHFGVAIEAHDRVLVSAAAHTPQRFDIGTGFSAALPDGNEQFADRSATHDYLPWITELGVEVAALQDGRVALDVDAALEFARWTTYVDRQSERPLPAYEWADTLSPTLGARVGVGDWTTFADLAWQPTPVPKQTGRTNYVDNDRASLALGFEHSLQVRRTTLRLGANLRGYWLVERWQDKREPPSNPIAHERDDRFGAEHYPSLVIDEVPDDASDGLDRRGRPLAGREGLQTNNPGYPGFGSSGYLAAGGITLAIEY